jgi:hypothetical protein
VDERENVNDATAAKCKQFEQFPHPRLPVMKRLPPCALALKRGSGRVVVVADKRFYSLQEVACSIARRRLTPICFIIWISTVVHLLVIGSTYESNHHQRLLDARERSSGGQCDIPSNPLEPNKPAFIERRMKSPLTDNIMKKGSID